MPGEDGFVAFEYISGPDYLNEGGKRTRGAQCTSVDAAMGLVREGRRELLLIEWKYTESYGAPLENKARSGAKDGLNTSNDVRRSRYSPWFEKVIDTDGGDRGIDLFFAEPFYQLMRQQMLAHAIESDTTDPRSFFDRVTLCHVSPEGNSKLKRVTVEGLAEAIGSESACGGWGRLLRQPDRYKPVSVEDLFRSFPIEGHPDLAEWHAYMRERYAFLA
ncbi:MAG TPA: hypothetical protein VGT77_06620 [Sphingomonas sp.]|nr:hypothetical protein [Sphingomonas sp.]